jgi:methionyl-tRNA synthetase
VSTTFYVTTPIYYVNGRPHIGHAYTTIAADALARWNRLRGRRTYFLTGTDEHGQKVYEAAEKRGMTPKAHCDDMVVHWKATFAKLGISYDRFFRTTDPDHVAHVRQVLSHLHQKGEIYLDKYEGWYHVGDEIFVPEKDLDEGKYKRDEVRWLTEENWYFRMGKRQEELVAYIEANPSFIAPESRRNEVLGFLRTKTLGDLCISRPKARMPWGIELPFAPDFVTYVWFDALLNYLTATGWRPGGGESGPDGFAPGELWPPDVQLLGKDILTTHAVYWSTMLMALELPLPKQLFAHGWWVAPDGEKMGKRYGNVIDVDALIEGFGVDATRYFFLREIRFGADGAFTYDGFQKRYNSDLANDLGNLANRTLNMVEKWFDGAVPAYGDAAGHEAELRALAVRSVMQFADRMDACGFDEALAALFTLVEAGNGYIAKVEPWALNKAGKTSALGTALRTALELTYVAAALLVPVLPTKAGELLAKLGRTEEDARRYVERLLEPGVDDLLLDHALDGLDVGSKTTVGDPLFPRFLELPPNIAALLAPVDATPEPEPATKPSEPKKSAEPKKESPVDTTTASAAAPETELIDYDHFSKIKLRTGRIVEADRHPNADKLLVLKVDVGEAAPRTIVAGIAKKFAPADLVGRNVVVVMNLKPAKLRGILSEGMLLAAGGDELIDLVSAPAEPGHIVR